MGELKIIPATGALGAEVSGIDLAPASQTALSQVKAALDEHLVLYLPDQQLDRFGLDRLGRFFGPPFLHPSVNNGFPDCPSVLELLRRPEDAISFGGEGWHADVTWNWYLRREDPQWTVTHPVVRSHPVTGRRGLYVNGLFTNRFKDMRLEESAPLLQFLCTSMERHEFTCRFRWRPGGVVLWDNRFTLHYPMNDMAGKQRRMIRTTSMEIAMDN